MATSRSEAGARVFAQRRPRRRRPPFRRVLIANRGEIAVRIIRACHELGMEAVAVYSDADAGAAHVRLADVAVRLGPAAADRELPADRRDRRGGRSTTGAEAIHPGYGFLAERAAFARAVEDAGLVFVGPPSAAIDALGDKLHARRTGPRGRRRGRARAPSSPRRSTGPTRSAAIVAEAEAIGFPLLVKAAAGGGGRGMRRVDRGGGPAGGAGRRIARRRPSAFGDGSVYLEREIRPGPPHRGPAPGRRRRAGRRARRARLLAPAAPPEARRGGAGAGPHGRRAPRPPRAGRPGRDGGRACGTRRRPSSSDRPDGRVLLPRGQHPAPGRARRDRARVRARHRPRAVLARGRAPAVARRRWRPPTAPPSRPSHAIEVRLAAEDPGARLRPDAGPGPALGDAGRARASGSTRRSRRATGSRPSTTT